MRAIHDNTPDGAQIIGAERCARALIAAWGLMAVLTADTSNPVLIFLLSLVCTYQIHTVMVGWDPIYFVANRYRVADRVQVWQYIAVAGVMVAVIINGHVTAPGTFLLFCSFISLIAVAALFGRDGPLDYLDGEDIEAASEPLAATMPHASQRVRVSWR
jgi:hypothetical protein